MKSKLFLIFFLVLLYGCAHKEHYIGEQYLGTKYLIDPLGEEKAPDKDPLLRTDAFDCMTFVETCLADGDIEKLNKIRYKDGKVDFINRNHFVETDWLNNNADLVENVSNQYGKTERKKIAIDKKSWFKKKYNINTSFKTQHAVLEYIPYSEFKPVKTDKPLIVLFVAGNLNFYAKMGTGLSVVHMGFLLPDGMLRHASKTDSCVTDTDFNEYIQKHKKYKKHIGFALVEIK